MTEIPITELTFGVELEVIMPAASLGHRGRNDLAERMLAAGIECAHESYNHRTRPHWKIVTDGSIGSDNAEVVSPILRGEDGFEQIRKVCRALDAHGCQVDRTTGLHVHVGARDRFSEQVGFFKELVRTYVKFEPVIDQLMARSRRAQNSRWCRPPVYNDAVERATTIDRVMRQANPARSDESDRRYSKLNLYAYGVHGTVEFRQHQGTTNAQKIENWVKLCLRMVAHAARNTEMAGSHGEFVPPTMPLRPTPPRFTDSTEARPVIVPHSELTQHNLRHFGRNWTIGRIGPNPRRSGAGLRNWPYYELGITIREYLARGGSWDRLRYDVGHYGAIDVVNMRQVPVPVVPGSDEANRREGLTREWRETVARMEAEHATAVEAARRAWEAARGAAPTVSRPPTDSAPATLEGLLTLVNAVESERAYFVERQMELN